MSTRRELVEMVSERYRRAGSTERQKMLDEFVTVTGYHRKHAIRVLSRCGRREEAKQDGRQRKRIYDEAVREVLVLLWEASDRICGRRLKPLLSVLVETMQRHGHLQLELEVRRRVLAVSASTLDRLLKPTREQAQGGSRPKRVGTTALRQAIPVRTFADWGDPAAIRTSATEGAGPHRKRTPAAFFRREPQALALAAAVEMVQAEMRGRSRPPNPAIAYSREDAAGSKEDYLLVEQRIPVSGRLGLLRQAADAAVQAERQQSHHALQQLRSDLRLAFYDLLLAQQRESAVRQGLSDLQEVVRILREREREGEGSTFDRLRAERELADIQSELTSLAAVQAQARAHVAAFLAPGTEPGSLSARGEFNIDRALPSLPELVARALEVRGDYRSEEEQLQRFQSERRAAERLRIPEPVLGAGLKKVQTAGISDTGPIVSVNVPLPLFNRGKTEAAFAQAAYERARADRLALQQEIASQVKASYAATELRRRLAQEYRRGVGERGARLAQIAQTAYQEGEQRILELLDAYRVTLASQLRVLELVAAAKQAEIELGRAVGEEVLP